MASIRAYSNQLFKISAEKDYWFKPLGEVDNYIIWLIRTRQSSTHNDPKVLIVAGFHGEEIAGPWGLLKWLKDSSDKWVDKIDISLIPIVNPYGFAHKKRYGLSGKFTNCGFTKPKSTDIAKNSLEKFSEEPSPEGQIIANNINLLRQLAQNGFMSLHEDASAKEYYLYAYEASDKPRSWVRSLTREFKKYFAKPYNGIALVDTSKDSTGPSCKNGLVYNFLDGSLESWMLELGSERCAVPETPGQYPLKKRVAATEAIINKFLSLTKPLRTKM